MISRVLAADLPEHVGEHVTIAGWLHRRRELKSVTFLIVRDRSGLAQVVAAASTVTSRSAAAPRRPSSRSSGVVTASPQAPGGAEITEPGDHAAVRARRAAAVRPLPAGASPPRCRRSSTARRPRLRHPRAAGRASRSRRPAWRASATRWTTWASPRSTRRRSSQSATESGANVFGIDYFGTARLPGPVTAVLQAGHGRACSSGSTRSGPVFRAEPHDTARHLAQYTSLDAELGFITDHHDVMAACRDAVARMVAAVSERARTGMQLLGAARALQCRPRSRRALRRRWS